MRQTQSGSCLCGQVKFEISGSFDCFYLCHCKFCQKDTGSAHAANLFSSTARLRWLSGAEAVRTFVLPSTRHTKSFCQQCGSALPNLQQGGALLVVPAGGLDTPLDLKPNGHLFGASRAVWDYELEEIPTFDTLPET